MAEAQRLHISTDLDDTKGRARLEIRLKIFNIVEYVPVLDQLGDLEEAKQLDELEETERVVQYRSPTVVDTENAGMEESKREENFSDKGAKW